MAAPKKKASAKKTTRKKPGPAKGSGGRPTKPLDWDMVDNMAAIDCTQSEIAAVFGVHIDTLTKRCKKERGKTFSEYLAEKREVGNVSLRRRFWKLVESGNVAATIFAAKNRLGYKDKLDVDSKQQVSTTATVIYESNGRELK